MKILHSLKNFVHLYLYLYIHIWKSLKTYFHIKTYLPLLDNLLTFVCLSKNPFWTYLIPTGIHLFSYESSSIFLSYLTYLTYLILNLSYPRGSTFLILWKLFHLFILSNLSILSYFELISSQPFSIFNHMRDLPSFYLILSYLILNWYHPRLYQFLIKWKHQFQIFPSVSTFFANLVIRNLLYE